MRENLRFDVPELERRIGIEFYATESEGIGGVIRAIPEDFVVKEISLDGKVNDFSLPLLFSRTPSKYERHAVFVLRKRKMDTFTAIRLLAKKLKLPPRRISYAGLKDANSVSYQRIHIESTEIDPTVELGLEGIALHFLGFTHKPLAIGDLLGNVFQVTIRKLSRSKGALEDFLRNFLEDLRERKFLPAFYGHQRFGTVRPVTHEVGYFLLKEDYERAVKVFLMKSFECESKKSREARKRLFKEEDYEQALKYFPKSLRLERLMIKHLAKKPDDFLGALRALPLPMRRMFVHAYQAYVFNKALSLRVKRGLPFDDILVNDIVLLYDGLLKRRALIASEQNVSELKRKLKLCKAYPALVVPGFSIPMNRGIGFELALEVLEKEKLSLDDFYTKDLLELRAPGLLRPCAMLPIVLGKPEVGDDELFPRSNKVRISFMLNRGFYATIFLRELMKPKNLVKSGF